MGIDRGVLVVGRIARDIALTVDAIPDAGGSTVVGERIEVLGGKGANQAVGLRQLGVERVALLGVAGADDVGAAVIARAAEDGVDVRHVMRRGATALLVDVVDASGGRRLLEHVPDAALLTPGDIEDASAAFDGVEVVCLQLQEPADALVAAAAAARAADARVVLDGGIAGPHRERLLGSAEVVRMDAAEAEQSTGVVVTDAASAERAARVVLALGPAWAAVAVPGVGDLVVWRGGIRLLPFGDAPVVDPTGAGDAFTAGLVAGMLRGEGPAAAGESAAAAAAATVSRVGGRPDLRPIRQDGRS
jgi:ribokinase